MAEVPIEMYETFTYNDPVVLPTAARQAWSFMESNSAAAVMKAVCPAEWQDIVQVLSRFRLNPMTWLKAGGNRGDISKEIDGEFSNLGWKEARLDLETIGLLINRKSEVVDKLGDYPFDKPRQLGRLP